MLAKIFRLIQEHTIKDFLSICKNSSFVNASYFIYLFDEKLKDNKEFKTNESILIRKGDIDELNYARKFVDKPFWEFQCHLHDGVDDFFIAENNDGIQHISWIYYSWHPNRLLSLEIDEVEIKYCLTMPESRGKNIYPAVIHQIIFYLQNHGVKRIFMCVRENNYSSIRGIEKAGFKKVDSFKLRRAFGIQIYPSIKTNLIK